MKQNSQWLSQVRTRSNSAEDTSIPGTSPASLRSCTVSSSWPRRTSSSGSASSTRRRYSITSRGTRPSTASSSSSDPEAGPLRRGGGRHGDHPRRRHAIQATWSHAAPCLRGAERTGPVAWDACRSSVSYWRRPGASAPESKRRSRRWRGWCSVFEPPVYCYHEIVHNRHVVDQFRAQGVVFVDDVDQVPDGRPADAVGPRVGSRGRRRRPATAGAWWSTPCARWSPRSTTS